MIGYLIVKTDKEYEARFEFSLGRKASTRIQEQFARAYGFKILYKAELRDPCKVEIIERFVEQANKNNNFDARVLEEMLSR